MREHKPYQKLKGKIRELGISYDKIAETLEISRASVANKINGSSDFSVSEAFVLQDTYGIGIENFLPSECHI